MTKKKSSTLPPRRVVHPDRFLRKATDYLEFDLHGFAAALDIHLKTRGTEVGNATFDSFMLRARILVDFLFHDTGRSDDVLAIDFFHDMSPSPFKRKMSEQLRNEREKMNKWVLHLTTQPMPRLRSTQRFSSTKIAKPIVTVFRRWLKLVPDTRIQQPAKESRAIFEKHLERIERLLP
jgi:hypothetical protein